MMNSLVYLFNMDEARAARYGGHGPVDNDGRDWCVCAQEVVVGLEYRVYVVQILQAHVHTARMFVSKLHVCKARGSRVLLYGVQSRAHAEKKCCS